MNPSIDDKRLAIEIIASLVHIKRTMVDLLLKPAGVPPEIYRSLLYQKDETTGRTMSKRDIAPLIIEEIDRRSDCSHVLRSLIEIAANWKSFHLADDEFAARAIVQKARECLDAVELMEAREAKQREIARKEELNRMEAERATLFKRQSDLLLMMFDEMARADNHQTRGFFLQDLLNRTFDMYEIPIFKSFTRNSGGEQIDGAFKLDGWHYLVECRWREKLADIRSLDGLWGQIGRSGKQTMGVFLSVNGWSENVVPLLKQNPDKCMLLMDGYDLRCVLSGQIDLRDFLVAKLAKLNLHSEPFYGAADFLKE